VKVASVRNKTASANFCDAIHRAYRVQPFEKLMGLGLMHRSIDDARRIGVYTNAILCVSIASARVTAFKLPWAITQTATGPSIADT
jgi:hypothetical protein